MTPKDFVTRLFERWEGGDMTSFFDAVSDDVRWTVTGHTPFSGTYTSKAEYFEKVSTAQEMGGTWRSEFGARGRVSRVPRGGSY
jgi:ketosteroid isomerase-like protein